MPKGPAARVGDAVEHETPPALGGVAGSPNVTIGGQPAWRGLPNAAASGLKKPKEAADARIKAAEAQTQAAFGTPSYPTAKVAEQKVKADTAAAMSSLILGAVADSAFSGGVVDVHTCGTLLPLPPHGPGVVVGGSGTVRINGLPACRMGDTIVEAVGPPNKVAAGCSTVIVGD